MSYSFYRVQETDINFDILSIIMIWHTRNYMFILLCDYRQQLYPVQHHSHLVMQLFSPSLLLQLPFSDVLPTQHQSIAESGNKVEA